jgi:hypothetical protein
MSNVFVSIFSPVYLASAALPHRVQRTLVTTTAIRRPRGQNPANFNV